jgi:threonine dehydrogenase-like Zn-dependent dehydrogenase
MRAAVVEEVGKLIVREVGAPEVGDYQCLCETQYGAVCTGTDNHIIQNRPPFCYFVNLPAILGHESVGRVTQLGSKVRNFKVGDLIARVGHPGADGIGAAFGGFAELTLATDWQAMRDDGLAEDEWKSHNVNQVIPAEISAAEATMFITWRETLSYVNRIGVAEGSTVLVIGSGANGLAMAAHAVNAGAKTVVLVGSPNRETEAKQVGCQAFISYKAEDAREQALAVCESGFGVAIDVIGTPATAGLAHGLVADKGTLGIYGMDDAASIQLNPNASFGTFTLYRGHYDEGESHDQVCELVTAGKLDASIWLDTENTFTLDEIGRAFEAAKNRTQVKPLIRFI